MFQIGTKSCAHTVFRAYNLGACALPPQPGCLPHEMQLIQSLPGRNLIQAESFCSQKRLNSCKLALLETCASELPKQWI
jgi:hypothetical protein